ncbi:MAG TPA: class II fructose-bisphosphatase [Thermomicrobiales bacterium]|nr:class II fructose-bisphosphatase [Thermomicrobiales bacterium]
MAAQMGATTIDRNLALELARVTEAAAMMSARWMGKGDKEAADQAAVDAMRLVLDSIAMDGVVVIGEGAKDEAPMLYIGEQVGSASEPKVDIAVDPIDGTRLLSLGMPNAVSVVAVADRGSMFASPDIAYMEKIAVGPGAAGAIDLDRSPTENVKRIAKAKGVEIGDLTVVILDRPRHQDLIKEVRATGARIKMITDGDVAGALMAAIPDTGIDALFGIGGAPEAVVAASALKCIGGDIQCRLWPRNDQERQIAQEKAIDVGRKLTCDDLVAGDNVFFAATGITDGELLKGVHYFAEGATTESLVMRSRSGTVRRIQSVHQLRKLRQYAAFPFD